MAALSHSSSDRGGIRALNEEIKRRGFALNQQGCELKVSVQQFAAPGLQVSSQKGMELKQSRDPQVSPDGGLLQSSTVADTVRAYFSE